MVELRHTPGPWECGFSHWGRWQIDSAKDDTGASFHIAELPSYGGLGGAEVELNERQKANALLIAAAPDLLAALRHAVCWFDQLKPEDIARYSAVIARATEGLD